MIVNINAKYNELRKKERRPLTNIVLADITDEMDVDCYENENGFAYVVHEPNRQKAFFAAKDEEAAVELLRQIPQGVILECLHRKEDVNAMENVILEAGFSPYKKYVRTTVCYKQNGYEVPEKGRRKLLQELYDPTCGEYPTMEDIDELIEISKANFDELTDDVFTKEEWVHVIGNQSCLVYKEAEKIIAYYVWRLDGKQLYSNMTLNLGAANYLYNMERRIYDEMWEKGIRVYYAWVEAKNVKARIRWNEEAKKVIGSVSHMYNSIYRKEAKK